MSTVKGVRLAAWITLTRAPLQRFTAREWTPRQG